MPDDTPTVPPSPAPLAPAPPAPAPPAPPTPATAPGAPEKKKFDVNAEANHLISQKGGSYDGAFEVVKRLLWDNQRGREKNAALRAQVAAPGDILLKPGPQLEEYQRFAKLGLTVADVEKKLGEHAVLQAEKKIASQKDFFRQAAEHAGIPNYRAFAKLAEKFGMEVQIKDVTETDAAGEKHTVKRAFARLASDTKAELRPLEVYLDEELREFRSALYEDTADDDGPGASGLSRPHAPEPRKGIPMPRQSAASGHKALTTTTDAVQDVTNQRYRHLKAPAK
jgi:hypothetical protein